MGGGLRPRVQVLNVGIDPTLLYDPTVATRLPR
jgi:hypothetical protein